MKNNDQAGEKSASDPRDASKREFLLRTAQGASLAAFSGGMRGTAFALNFAEQSQVEEVGFHLNPHYRENSLLESALLKSDAGLDDFVTEKYSERIEAVFADWSRELLQIPADIQAVDHKLADTFSGQSFKPSVSRAVRSGSGFEIRYNEFSDGSSLAKREFLDGLGSLLNTFAKIETAEFQIVSLDASGMQTVTPNANAASASSASGLLKTRIRYDLVGAGKPSQLANSSLIGPVREQRVGHWEIEWRVASGKESESNLSIVKWRSTGETWSRVEHPASIDIAAQAFGGNSSFEAQMLLGADHWRTILDGACGVDIYGHNGISVADIDGDGFDDVYVCQPAGLPNRLYRNRGDGTFEDITEASGLGILENTACALFADFDNDGRQDVIVVRADGPVLFHNEGQGKFRKVENAFNFVKPPQGTFTGAAVADYDCDGWLDIYFCLYLYYQGSEQYQYPSPYYAAENGPPNFLMRSNRDGTFSDVTAEAGLDKNNTRYSFCCGWGDFNHDGWPDLYVVNDFGRKNLYRNNGDGTFTDVAGQAGVEDIGAGMSICNIDYNNDGEEDLYVANMWTAAGNRISTQAAFQENAPEPVRALYRKHAMGNSLFRNNGDGTFRDTSDSSGVGMGRWSWSSDAWDFDHDGFADLYITNGMISGPLKSQPDLNGLFWRQVVAKSPEKVGPSRGYELGWNAINELIRSDGNWSGFERNVFYMNNRDGTFSDVSGALGLDFIEDGRAFALADFDHDGRLEAFVKNRNSPQLRVVKNVLKKLPSSISFRLRGTGKSNRDAVGTVVTIRTEFGNQRRSLQAGSGFLSQHSKDVFFGLGEAKSPLQATIRWPSGSVQELHDLPIDCRVWVEEGSQKVRTEPFSSPDTHVPKASLFASPGGIAEAASLPRAAKTQLSQLLGIGGISEGRDSANFPAQVETWLIAPMSAPDFELSDLSGVSHALSALRGKRVVLHFWATASTGYREDLQALAQLQRSRDAKEVAILTVNVDGNEKEFRAANLATEMSLPILRASEDVAAIYNLLFRQLFDRHRDMPLPCSFLLDEKGEIVKVYQGPVNAGHLQQDLNKIPRNSAERLALALPFSGVSNTGEFRRNHLSFGSLLFQHGYYEQASSTFELALRDDPSSAEALYGLGSAYLKRGNSIEAQNIFERATRARASFPETLPNSWNNLGLLATRAQQFDAAILYFQKAVDLSPANLTALTNLGNAYRQQKRWEEARTTLGQAIQVDPKSPEANYSLGMVFAQLDENAEAYKYLQAALQFRPDYPEALNNVGVLYVRAGSKDEAIKSFEECIRVAPDFDQSYLNLAKVYALEGQMEKARAILRALLKQHPEHVAGEEMLEQLGK